LGVGVPRWAHQITPICLWARRGWFEMHPCGCGCLSLPGSLLLHGCTIRVAQGPPEFHGEPGDRIWHACSSGCLRMTGMCEVIVARDPMNSQGIRPWLPPNHLTACGPPSPQTLRLQSRATTRLFVHPINNSQLTTRCAKNGWCACKASQ
jgi:hypothetical protein